MRISDWSSDVCSSDLAGARCAAIDGTTERLADYIARPARRSVRLGRAAGFARGATRTGVDAAFRIKAAATGDAADGITADRAKTAAKRTAQRSAERAAKAATAAQKLSRGRSCCQGTGRRRRGDTCLFHLSSPSL